jgi:hypothetical protein
MNTLLQYINLLKQNIVCLVQSPLLFEDDSKYGSDRFHTAEYSAYDKDEQGETVNKHVVRAQINGVKARFYCNTSDRWEACVKALARRTVTIGNTELSLPTPAYGDSDGMTEFIKAFNVVINTHGKGFRANARDEDDTDWLDFPEAQEMMLDENVRTTDTDFESLVANALNQAQPQTQTAPTPNVAPQAIPQPETVQPAHNAEPNVFA